MSQKEMESIVKEFLKQVKKKLPDWLKNKKSELSDIMDELDEHIWAKAEELSGIGQPTEDSIRMAIAHMGTPTSIAREYKSRGTPKVYITEELWPLYQKVLGILIAVVFIVNVISFVLNGIFGSWWNFDFGGIFFGLTGVFTIITVIFVALSLQGYFPEDFKSEADRKREFKELKKAEKKGWPISIKSGKPLKPFMNPASMIIGGIIQMAIALIFFLMPSSEMTALMNPQFLMVIRLFGVFMLMEGTIDLIRGVIGRQQVSLHQVLMIVKVGISLASISLIVILMNNPEIISIINWNESTGLTTLEISEGYLELISIGFAWIIVLVVLGALSDVIKAIRLERYKKII